MEQARSASDTIVNDRRLHEIPESPVVGVRCGR